MLNEVAIVVVGDNMKSRDIIIQQCNGSNLQSISETHRSYDALQYPLIFYRGEDGYHFGNSDCYVSIQKIKTIVMVESTTVIYLNGYAIYDRNKQITVVINYFSFLLLYKEHYSFTGQGTNKKVSSMNFYAYRFMIHLSEDNYILKWRQLFHQFAVDTYAKIETERLTYICLRQKELRSEQYIRLCDTMNADRNGNNVGQLIILPATYVGSPRHMQEYAQDAMTYVCQYSRPDLFITFTCNPKWIEITNLLLPGQSSSDRHHITARVLK